MEKQEVANPKQELLGVYKTIFLFLKNENFTVSSEAFKKECESFGCQIPDISSKVLLHAGRKTHSVGNQTEPSINVTNNVKNETFTLDSSFQEGFSYKPYPTKESRLKTDTSVLPQNTSQNDEPDFSFNSSTFNEHLHFISLTNRFSQLQEEHRKLIAVTAELTNALQLNIMGQARNMHHVLDQCKTIYPSLFISQDKHHQQSGSGEVNTKVNLNQSARNEQATCTTDHEENLPKNQKTASEENLIRSNVAVSDNQNKNLLNLDIEDIDHNGNEEELQLYTPVSEKEIKDILEIILNKAINYLCDGERNSGTNCCDIGRACMDCRKEISKIVESILIKVMESPRYKTSPRYSNSVSSCHTNQLESNQYQVQISNKLPHKLRNGLSTVNVDDNNKTNDNKVQTEKPKTTFSGRDLDINYLNYEMVKNGLAKLDNEKVLHILQALRRRLTKNKAEERNTILDTYIQQDILNLHEKDLWPELLLRRNCEAVNEYLIRILNTIASFRKGRDYLGSNEKVLKSVLLPRFMIDHENSATNERGILIATLQKLSLQKHMRIQMINEGLLDYLVRFLDESYHKLTLYSLEHCTALLMNLCLVDEAKKYCINNAERVIKLLKKFLAEQHTSFLPYINGTLLSLLVHEDIRFEAKKQRLDQVVQQLIKNTKDEYLRQQLNFIIHSRFGGQLHSFIGDEGEHFQEPDILESELDTESEGEVDLDGAAKTGGKKSDKQGMPKDELDATRMHSLPNKFRKENYHVDASTGVEVFEPSDQKNIKTSIANSGKRKRLLRRYQNFPNSSFCYLEICHGFQGGNRICRCSKCVPGKNKYSCGCYDMICDEVAEEVDNAICKGQTVNRTKYIKKTFREDSIEVIENTKNNGSCAICGDKICDCAFESRPKIHRTPPKT